MVLCTNVMKNPVVLTLLLNKSIVILTGKRFLTHGISISQSTLRLIPKLIK